MGKPVTLVAVGAVAQALMLPFVSLAALYFLYYETHERPRPKASWIFCLWISAIAMAAWDSTKYGGNSGVSSVASDGLGPLEKSRAAALASPAAGALGAYVAHAADALRPKARVGLARMRIICSAECLVFFIDGFPVILNRRRPLYRNCFLP